MADEHAVIADEQDKIHGDELDGSLKSGTAGAAPATTHNNAVPPAENGGHNRSVAAHLHESEHLHDNKNAVQHHVAAHQMPEPPMRASRDGKGHRG